MSVEKIYKKLPALNAVEREALDKVAEAVLELVDLLVSAHDDVDELEREVSSLRARALKAERRLADLEARLAKTEGRSDVR